VLVSEHRPLLDPGAFVGLEDATYLFSAAEGPMLRTVAEHVQTYLTRRSEGLAGRLRHHEEAERCRNACAALFGVGINDIALVPSATAGINAVVAACDLRAGDNVVVNDLEFPSVVLPFMHLKSQGVDVRVVRHRNWILEPGELLAAVDSKTRVLAVSHVSYVNGLRNDLKTLRAGLSGSNAIFLVDATQTAGVLPVEVDSTDFVVASGYKWLLGIHGAAVLYWNRARRPDWEPRDIGPSSVASPYGPDRYSSYEWKESAARFELGYPPFPPIYALAASIPVLLAYDPDAIARHVLRLGAAVRAGLQRLGLKVMTPADPDRRGASISFAHPEADEIGRRLAADRVHVWAGDGRVRASTHLFNCTADVDSYLDRLEAALRHVQR
jgi:selenocysteine lyase/cysteine desulfurase